MRLDLASHALAELDRWAEGQGKNDAARGGEWFLWIVRLEKRPEIIAVLVQRETEFLSPVAKDAHRPRVPVAECRLDEPLVRHEAPRRRPVVVGGGAKDGHDRVVRQVPPAPRFGKRDARSCP
jgi:hypothetical protein